MKKKITFPDWTSPAAVAITRGGKDGKRPVWSEYTKDPADFLSLRVTLEIAGGSTFFETFDSEEARDTAYTERSRQTTWRNALAFAEHLWGVAQHREYVVMFRPENPNVGREAICIYQRLPPYPAAEKAVQ